MQSIQFDIPYLAYHELTDPKTLHEKIYPNSDRDYYWSDDFSPEFYIAQAKAGFIAMTESHEGRELLVMEISHSCALLDWRDLHRSRKVTKLLTSRGLQLEVDYDPDEVCAAISAYHAHSWLTPRYFATLKATVGADREFRVISACLRDRGRIVAGEIGYRVGGAYVSLSGFSSPQKQYRNYGTAQLVLLGEYLRDHGYAFWNLGQPYMPYKFALGAKLCGRKEFLERWQTAKHM